MSVTFQCNNSGDSCQLPKTQSWQLRLPVQVHTPLMMHVARELLKSACRSTRDSMATAGTATAAAFCSSSCHATDNAACNSLQESSSTEKVLHASFEMPFCELLNAAFTDCAAVSLQKAAAFAMPTDTSHCSGFLATALLRNSIFALAFADRDADELCRSHLPMLG